MTTPAHRTGRTGHTPGPWTVADEHPKGVLDRAIMAGGFYVATVHDTSSHEGCWEADARLIAAAPDTLDALRKIRLWLAVEGCWEQVEIADNALVAAGETDVACQHCSGAGEWDEGPLPATSSAQISPDYRQVKCHECIGTGRVSLSVSRGDGPDPGLTDAEQKTQGQRCGCLGSDDYCACQNVPDFKTKAARRAALSASRSTGDQS